VLLFIPLVGALFGVLGGTLGAACPCKPCPARAWSGALLVLR
jgi:hypothetical protein